MLLLVILPVVLFPLGVVVCALWLRRGAANDFRNDFALWDLEYGASAIAGDLDGPDVSDADPDVAEEFDDGWYV